MMISPHVKSIAPTFSLWMTRPPVAREPGRGENPLPRPIPLCPGIFAIERVGQINPRVAVFHVLFMPGLDLSQVPLERPDSPAASSPDPSLPSRRGHDARITEIHVLDSKAHAFHQAQPAAVKQTRH